MRDLWEFLWGGTVAEHFMFLFLLLPCLVLLFACMAICFVVLGWGVAEVLF